MASGLVFKLFFPSRRVYQKMIVSINFYPELESVFRNVPGPGQQPQLREVTILNSLSILFYGHHHPVLPPLIQFLSLIFCLPLIQILYHFNRDAATSNC